MVCVHLPWILCWMTVHSITSFHSSLIAMSISISVVIVRTLSLFFLGMYVRSSLVTNTLLNIFGTVTGVLR
ncbi:MAG: hypothetical protein NXY57DRAFT_1033272 [Lentinula lateritia]|nr:MAG: hypothetical protein NXY57DRAFT_1033272 [Lentinula lateritia]